MRTLLVLTIFTMVAVQPLHAAQSVIIDTTGYACMGDDRSRKETEHAAIDDAQRNAGETALTYIKSETNVNDGVLEKDLLSTYVNAKVKMLQELKKEWYQDPASGDCCRVRLKMEVTPDAEAMANLSASKKQAMLDNPAAPLAVKIWTDKARYLAGEKIRIFIKGNRPFYGKVIYKDVGGNLTQLLPNPYRNNNYFNGGTVYELPAGDDRYALEVCPPFGTETVTLYASTSPLGELYIAPQSGVYTVRTNASDVPAGVRGIKFVDKEAEGKMPAAAEFAEMCQELSTSIK